MENYQIVPWIDHMLSPDIVHEQYVPPELEALARQVMEQYDMKVHEMVLITSKPDKGGAIWKIGTDKGNRSIKVLHRSPKRSLFSIGAQAYLSEKGHRVPAFILTKDGNNCVEAGGKLWIVTEWIEPLTPVSKVDLTGAAELCYGLGEFHASSKGYIPPFGAEKSSRLYGWGKNYEKIIAKIGWFRDLALAYPGAASSSRLLSVIDEFERQANDIYTRFLASSYTKMTAKGEPHWGLAHQDYGWSNGQMGTGGIWVIDLDGVSYDLPFRDLRKIITSTMDDMGVWDLSWIRGMIEAYHKGNPMDRETFEILWLDMAFPNEFYKHVKEIVFNPGPFMELELAPILDRVMATEPSKWEALRELEKDMASYLPGDYTTVDMPSLVFDRPNRELVTPLPSFTLPAGERAAAPESVPMQEPAAAELEPIAVQEPAVVLEPIAVQEPVSLPAADPKPMPVREPAAELEPVREPMPAQSPEPVLVGEPVSLPRMDPTSKPMREPAAAELEPARELEPVRAQVPKSKSKSKSKYSYKRALPQSTPEFAPVGAGAGTGPGTGTDAGIGTGAHAGLPAAPVFVMLPNDSPNRFTMTVPKKRKSTKFRKSSGFKRRRKSRRLVHWRLQKRRMKRRTQQPVVWKIAILKPKRKSLKAKTPRKGTPLKHHRSKLPSTKKSKFTAKKRTA
ncbi:CotS family spore coat protein [Paenibacillus oryzisoli]|uniref:CotS family spore coat protein n=1 Tax=Paenibacillus oryzisoli TaxID=1850517 RepID=UPI003D2C3FA3